MGLIALIAFWVMVCRLWITVGLKTPLIFVGIWFASAFLLALVNLSMLFVAVEAILVIFMFFIEKKHSL